MVYLVWILTGLAVVLGFLLGVLLGKRHDFRKEAVGTIHVAYFGDEVEPEMFLTLDNPVSTLEGKEYAVLRLKTGKARK